MRSANKCTNFSTAGYRAYLAYTYSRKTGKKIAPATVEAHALQVADIIKQQEQTGDTKLYIVLLSHPYTPLREKLNQKITEQ